MASEVLRKVAVLRSCWELLGATRKDHPPLTSNHIGSFEVCFLASRYASICFDMLRYFSTCLDTFRYVSIRSNRPNRLVSYNLLRKRFIRIYPEIYPESELINDAFRGSDDLDR